MVVATATIALQNQVVDRDLPALVDAVEPLLGRRPTYAILKGRSNYLCRNKVLGGMPDDDERRAVRPVAHDGARAGTWCGCAAGPTRPRPATATSSTPASTTGPGGRSASPRASAWAPPKCPYGEECFAELARDRAAEVEIVVTNHALLAIDALESFAVLPEHDAVVVDEAHELVDRVTGVATDELTAPMVERAAARARRLVDGTEDLADAAAALEAALADAARGPGRRPARAAGHRGGPGPRRGARRASPRSARAKEADDGARKVARGGGRGGARDGRAGRRPLAVRRDLGGRTTRVAGRCSRSRRCRSTGCCARRCSASARWC